MPVRSPEPAQSWGQPLESTVPDQAGMIMKAAPGSALEMSQVKSLFQEVASAPCQPPQNHVVRIAREMIRNCAILHHSLSNFNIFQTRTNILEPRSPMPRLMGRVVSRGLLRAVSTRLTHSVVILRITASGTIEAQSGGEGSCSGTRFRASLALAEIEGFALSVSQRLLLGKGVVTPFLFCQGVTACSGNGS